MENFADYIDGFMPGAVKYKLKSSLILWKRT